MQSFASLLRAGVHACVLRESAKQVTSWQTKQRCNFAKVTACITKKLRLYTTHCDHSCGLVCTVYDTRKYHPCIRSKEYCSTKLASKRGACMKPSHQGTDAEVDNSHTQTEALGAVFRCHQDEPMSLICRRQTRLLKLGSKFLSVRSRHAGRSMSPQPSRT